MLAPEKEQLVTEREAFRDADLLQAYQETNSATEIHGNGNSQRILRSLPDIMPF
jgi:hypothetical protein